MKSIVGDDRIARAIQQRYSPFPTMTMDLLSSQLNQFRIGQLRPAARSWEVMMERDGDLSVPAEKLYSDIARLPWDIEKEEKSAEADRHAEALTYFYTNLTARSVLEGDERGGINLLLRQMMSAHANRYSPHEMVLQINSASKKEVTATFNHCPVWFFESTKGRLAYLETEGALYGKPLQRGEWLVSVGRGMMRQCSVAYLMKWEPLTSWLLFCYRFGVPGVHGETSATEGSEEWNKFAAAVASFASDWATITSLGGNKISLVESAKGGQGTLPFPELIERADRLYARAFRGGDLSTQSRDGGDVAGSNPQEGEKRIILEDGGQWATDILNAGVDEPIIEYLFNTTPKAWICIRPPKQLDSNREINALKAARDLNIPVSIDTARDRLELPAPEDDADLIASLVVAPDTTTDENGKPIQTGSAGTPGADVQATALNGAQVTALAELASNVAQGLLPLATAQSIAVAAFPLVSPAVISKIFSPLKSFTPETPAAPAQATQAVSEVKALANSLTAAELAADEFKTAVGEAVQPVAALINRITEIQDDAKMMAALETVVANADKITALVTADVSKPAAALEKITAPALAAGLEGKKPS